MRARQQHEARALAHDGRLSQRACQALAGDEQLNAHFQFLLRFLVVFCFACGLFNACACACVDRDEQTKQFRRATSASQHRTDAPSSDERLPAPQGSLASRASCTDARYKCTASRRTPPARPKTANASGTRLCSRRASNTHTHTYICTRTHINCAANDVKQQHCRRKVEAFLRPLNNDFKHKRPASCVCVRARAVSL